MVEARLENWRLVDMKTQASKRFDKKLFEKAVIDSFHFLQDRYGFSAPVANDYGREIFVKYERGNQTVSVSYEYGMTPLIEIFYPSVETGDRPVPWAEKNNVQRSRRFPKYRLAIRFSDDENSTPKYIKEMSLEFEKTESSWLNTKQIT
jgi:hypothetical protein